MHDPVHDLVGNEVALLHELERPPPDVGAIADRLPEDLPRRDMRQPVLALKHFRLRPLAGTGWAHEDQVHAAAITS